MRDMVNKGMKVDAIITDLPYEITTCSWDSKIPFEPMWDLIGELIKPETPICLFGTEPFSSALRLSNLKMYKYDWIWKKSRCSNFLTANYQPRRIHEIISVFSRGAASYSKKGNNMTYNPQMGETTKVIENEYFDNDCRKAYSKKSSKGYKLKHNNVGRKFPESVVYFPSDKKAYHPTSKPLAFMEYLIRTYTNEGGVVLDFTAGGGSTLVASVNTNRKFIGIELENKYFEICVERVKEALNARSRNN